MIAFRPNTATSLLYAVFIATATFLSDSTHANDTAVIFEAFEHSTITGLKARAMKNAFLSATPHGGVASSAGLRAAYHGYDRGSKRIAFEYPLGRALESATLNYDVRFDPDFQFVLGGKLHGLGSKKPVTGGEVPGKGQWSARLMWDVDGAIRSYLYHQNQFGTWGDTKGTSSFRFVPGKWHAVSLHTKINHPHTAANGKFEVYVDGIKRISHDKIRFRAEDTPESLVNNLLFSTFHGGNVKAYAPKDHNGSYTTTYATFDNFEVKESKAVRSGPLHVSREPIAEGNGKLYSWQQSNNLSILKGNALVSASNNNLRIANPAGRSYSHVRLVVDVPVGRKIRIRSTVAGGAGSDLYLGHNGGKPWDGYGRHPSNHDNVIVARHEKLYIHARVTSGVPGGWVELSDLTVESIY